MLCASLLAGRAVVGVVAPWQPESTTAAKLQLLEGTDVDLVFVGSSRVFRQVDPATVDARLATHGLEVDSLNLGIPGMASTELLVFAERALGAARGSPRWLVVDIRYVEPSLGNANVATRRVTWWHDLPATAGALAASVRSDTRPVGTRLGWAVNHAVAFTNRTAGTGVILDRLAGQGIDPLLDVGADGTGFVSLDTALEVSRGRPDPAARAFAGLLTERRDALATDGIRAFRGRVSRLTELLSNPPPPTELQIDYVESLDRIARRHSARLILLVPPGVSPGRIEQGGTWLAGAAASLASRPAVINLNDPRDYPELFEFELWFDANHLGLDGARLFSSLLADALAEVLFP